MQFRILGPLEAVDGTRTLPLGGARQRTVLAILLLHPNEVVSTDVLIDELWGDHPPGTARTALQGYVSRLRRAFGHASSALVTRSPGYLLELAPGELDGDRFEALLAETRRERVGGNVAVAAALLQEALALWRGPALADFRYAAFAQNEIARLEELRVATLEARVELELERGSGADVVGELEALVAAHPLRERFRGQLMLALYRSGRQAEALAAYQDARRLLVEELGIEPGPGLQRLEQDILRQEPRLDAPASELLAPAEEPADAGGPPREMRKTVTVAAFALAHAAAAGGRLDPEALLRVKARSIEAVTEVLERHGGTAAGVAGETLVGVFGIPLLHEDDAFRALRAAAEASELLPALSDELEQAWRARLAVRTGVVTGEVVDGASEPAEGLLTTEIVAGAMRLADQATPGETLLDETSRRLARDAIRIERGETSDLDGGSAWKLAGLIPDAPPVARRFDAPLVGREREIAQLREAFARTLRERTPHLMTVLGPAGIGKSRLAGELPSLVGEDARVLTGRCLSYGNGNTFWPLQEIVHEAAGEKPLETVFECLGGGGDSALVAELIAATLGLADGRAASEEETFWAVCRLVEAIARERALVVVLEDLHWAEPTFLDLVEHLAGRACDAPVLLVCLARPELLETRPQWGGGKPNATSLFLEPLFPEESEDLLENLLGGAALSEATRRRIAGAAEGNPLFLEQLLAMATEAEVDGRELSIPPTIEALLAARLDRLGPGERDVLDRASVVGREFWPDAVADLLPEEARAAVKGQLEALVRKELVRPLRGPGGEELFRFRHVLIQQVACGAVPKELRADLHERFAAWLARRAGERVAEFEEIVGYHLEQAFRYREELGPVDAARALGVAAAERLGAAGHRAGARGDAPGAVNLLGRATALLAEDEPGRPALLAALGGALLEAGELAQAELTLADALDAAEAARDTRLAAHVVLQQAFLLLHMGAESSGALALAERTIPLFMELGDDEGLAKASHLIGEAELTRGRIGRAAASWERALVHARAAGDRRGQAEVLVWLTMALAYGPTPVPEALARLDGIVEEGRGDPRVTASAFIVRASLVATQRQFEEARSLVARGRAILEELGLRVRAAMAPASHLGQIEILAGDPGGGEAVLRSGCDALERMGEKAFLSTLSAQLAEALYAEGRYEEAEKLTEASEAAAASDDVASQIGWRNVRAKVLAQRGDLEEATRLAHEAVELADETDMLDRRADSRVTLAEVLRLADALGESPRLLEEAWKLYEEKQNVVLAERTRALLEEQRISSSL